MTKVIFLKKNNMFVGVECIGHTGYAEEGEDIVCSALSSIIQSHTLGILQVLNIKANVKVKEEKGYYKVELPQNIAEQDLELAQILLKTMFLSVKDLVSGYSKYINLEEKEYVY